MALVQKLRRWASFASHSFATTRCYGIGPLSFFPRRGFCSVPEGLQLTLLNLGFKDDAQEGLETPNVSIHECSKRPQRRFLEQSQRISVAVVAKPSQEDMKQAALEASNILAGIAGMQLPRPKKLAGEQVSLKQVASEEEEEAKLEPTLENMERTDQKMTLSHPWPEWLEFLEDIRTKDFFEGSEQGVEEGKHLFESYAAVRHAVCAFGRTHSDIFRSLSRKNLRLMANYGCPDLERKASNASKRLRAHFRIPEGEVCQHCRLKMTCPRAFLAPPTKLPVNTLDVVRIITGFATNVWPNADCFTSYPKELETSVLNLLREILTFNGLPRDLDEGAPEERSSLESVQTTKKVKNSHSVDQKPGDWTCPNCEFLNFNRNRRCRECRVFRPPQDKQKMLLGDWECSKCRYLNFSKNMHCRECNADRLSKVKWMGGERLPDDYPLSRRQEKKYEASEDEGSWETALINSAEETNIESDANFTDEEEMVLSQHSSNAASRRVPKARFRWNEDEGEEKGVYMISKNSKGR